MRVLIVDDHDKFRTTVRRLLEADGLEVVGEAANGEAAIRAVAQFQPDVVLLDVMLPDIDGFAVCAELHTTSDPPRVVMTSTRDRTTFRRRLEHSQARGFIRKDDLSTAAIAEMVR